MSGEQKSKTVFTWTVIPRPGKAVSIIVESEVHSGGFIIRGKAGILVPGCYRAGLEPTAYLEKSDKMGELLQRLGDSLE